MIRMSESQHLDAGKLVAQWDGEEVLLSACSNAVWITPSLYELGSLNPGGARNIRERRQSLYWAKSVTLSPAYEGKAA